MCSRGTLKVSAAGKQNLVEYLEAQRKKIVGVGNSEHD